MVKLKNTTDLLRQGLGQMQFLPHLPLRLLHLSSQHLHLHLKHNFARQPGTWEVSKIYFFIIQTIPLFSPMELCAMSPTSIE